MPKGACVKPGRILVDTWRAGHVAAWRWTALVAVLSFVVAVAIACSPQERFLLAVSGGGAVALPRVDLLWSRDCPAGRKESARGTGVLGEVSGLSRRCATRACSLEMNYGLALTTLRR